MAATTNAASNSAQDEQIVPISKLWWVGLVAAAGASIANLVFFWVTKSVFGISYIIPMGGPSGPLTAMPAGLIVVFCVVPAVGATILLAILSKVASRPMRAFWIISAVVFVISFVLPIGLPSSVATSTRIGLALMHVIAAAVIVGVLSTLGRQKQIHTDPQD